MGVGAAEPERRDTRQQGTVTRGEVAVRRDHLETEFVERNVRVRRLVVEVGGDATVLQRQHGLGETGDSGGGLGVTQVALDRSDQQRSVRRPAAAEHGAQRAGLDRITQQGARAVRLDVVDLAGFDPGCRARRAQHGHLGSGVGRHQTVGPPVLVDRGAADDGQDPVAVAFGVGEALEDGDAAALAAHVSVRAGVEGVTPAGGRHRLDLVETPGDGR